MESKRQPQDVADFVHLDLKRSFVSDIIIEKKCSILSMRIRIMSEFEKEVECSFKGKRYSVRDDGSIFRHAPDGKKPTKLDNVWTYGKYNPKTGYAEFGGERVHRIVATAFHGPAPSPQHVVDHIDTNRRNNRPENLRWVSKLENILLNPITVKKIEYLYGSVEAFLENPRMMPKEPIDQNFEWMRAVTKEEAAACLEHFMSWVQSDAPQKGRSIGEWVYSRGRVAGSGKETTTTDVKTIAAQLGIKSKPVEREPQPKPERKSISNPFDFPREEDSDPNSSIKFYRTRKEKLQLVKKLFANGIKVALPAITLPTGGKGFLIRDTEVIDVKPDTMANNGKDFGPTVVVDIDIDATTPSEKVFGSSVFIIKDEDNERIALVINTDSDPNEKITEALKDRGYDIVFLNMSWARKGVTCDEMVYILSEDVSKKTWFYHHLIEDGEKRLEQIAEPIEGSGGGIAHLYYACPLTSESVQDMDCWYCDYRLGKDQFDGLCFAKAGVKSYQDLLEIENVEKDDGKIVSITYNKKGEKVVKTFDKDVQLPGESLLELWRKKKGPKLIAKNIYNDWYVLLEKDPVESIAKNKEVFGRLSRNPLDLIYAPIRSIFNYDCEYWVELVDEE